MPSLIESAFDVASVFNLRDELEGCLDLVVVAVTAKQLELVCHIEETCPERVLGDVVRLRQIIANLLANAVKFTQRGEVLVAVSSSADDNPTSLRALDMQVTSFGMRCTSAVSPAEAPALVADGLAYDVAVLDMVMPQMDGLELSAALTRIRGDPAAPHVLLTSMGWRSANGDRPFAAYLTKPVRRASLHDALLSALSGQTQGAPSAHLRPTTSERIPVALRILMAEDNPVNQRVAQLILGKLGQVADIVDNGLDAVHAVRDGDYDVVLMDVQMPQLDGLEATRRIRAQPNQHQPFIIALTAGALPEDRDACMAAGMDGYLAKPVRAKELRDVLLPFTAPVVVESRADLPTPPAIDLVIFDDLMAQLDDGDGLLRGTLIDSYLADGEVHLTKLTQALATSDTTTASICAHTLRSTSALVGATGLADLLQQIEDSARTAPAALDALANRARVEYARVRESLSSSVPLVRGAAATTGSPSPDDRRKD